jgi:ferredoxin
MCVARSRCWKRPSGIGGKAAVQSSGCALKLLAAAAVSPLSVPANQTMLEALEAAGVEMSFECRRGECGLCALPILAVDGIVDQARHLPPPASPEWYTTALALLSPIGQRAMVVSTARSTMCLRINP